MKIQDSCSPSIEKHEIGSFPGIVKTEGSSFLFNLRGRKLSSSRLAVTLNEGGVSGGGITGVGMDTHEDKAIRCEYLLFKKTENKTFLLLKKCNVVWSCRSVVKVKHVIDVVASSSGKKVMVPGSQRRPSLKVL